MKKIQRLTQSDVKVSQIEPLHKGFINVSRYHVSHKLHEGGWSDKLEREVAERHDAVVVLPYDPQLDCFVLIEQFRVGAIRENITPWLLECVAGINDKNETPEALCHRELFEEAGLKSTKLIKALSYFSSPGASTEYLHVFIGLVDASKAGGVHGVEQESEDILVHKISKAQAIEWLAEGRINNAATIIALQWFFMNEQTIQEKG